MVDTHARPAPPPVSTSGRRRRSRRRRIGIAIIITFVVLVLAGVWLGVTALMARSELNQARAEIHTLGANLSASKWPAARTTAADLASHAHRADQLTSGPVWALAAALPWVGDPLRTTRGITSAVDSLGQEALPQLVAAAQRLDPRTVRRPDGSIDVARIKAVAPALASASANLDQTIKTMSDLPKNTWVSSIDTASADALKQVATLDDTLKSANLAVRILPTMLGADGPKRYFVAFQNDAEARGTGGLPGAFAILEANRGKVRFARLESDSTLDGAAAKVDLGPDYRHLYGYARPTTIYKNTNLSPNFPYAAQIWASMWQKYSGEKVDGALAVDPTALSYLLAVTGPATLPDKSKVSAGNVVSLSQSTLYAKFPADTRADVAKRRAYLLDIADAASKRILEAHGEPTALLRAAGKAAGERRILVWSADPAIQADLARTSAAGIIPTTTAPYVGLTVNNGSAGNKLDYYLDRSVTWQRTGCGPKRLTTVTITLTNNAPATGLPQYVAEWRKDLPYPAKPGDNTDVVSYFATQGAHLESITVEGRPVSESRVAGQPGKVRIGAELGHPVYALNVEVPRGTSRTIVLHLSEPAGTGAPIVLRQPLVRPLNVTLKDAICG